MLPSKLALFCCALAVATTAWQASAPLARHSLTLSASSLDNPSTKSSTQQAPPGDSSRLTKAKLLLKQFQTGTDDSTATLNNSPGEVVPDTYWRNGHLLEGDSAIVTRWARGVKVAEPLTTYDPAVAATRLFQQPAKWLVRNVQIAWPMGLWATGVVMDYVLRRENRGERAKQLRLAISGLGPAIIKGGQALASRPDLLPSEYLNELQKLQDDVPRFADQLAFKIVEQELEIDDFHSVFELVESEPVAAASIGQVRSFMVRCFGNLISRVGLQSRSSREWRNSCAEDPEAEM